MLTVSGWDISADHEVPSVVGQSFGIFRACLANLSDAQLASDKQQSFVYQLAEVQSRAPEGFVTGDYSFLGGPGRGVTVQEQVDFYHRQHRAMLSCYDWEEDSFEDHGVTRSFGIASPQEVAQAVHSSRAAGLRVGVYAQESRLTTSNVALLLEAGAQWLWIAAWGIQAPLWLVNLCDKRGIVLMHQTAGTTIDRDELAVGTLADLQKLGGLVPPTPQQGATDVATNLFKDTVLAYGLDLPAGAQFFDDTSLKTPFSHPNASAGTFALLGAIPEAWHVANGDHGVYFPRTATGPQPRKLDKPMTVGS